MNAQVPFTKIWFALLLMGGEYALLGWYLAAHHVFWLIGTFIVGLTFAMIWKKNPILNFVRWFIRQQVLVLLGLCFLLSLIIAFAFIQPASLSISLLPFFTLLYALLEMQTAELRQFEMLVWLVTVTTLGLGLGEAIDLFVIPSMRY